MTNNEFQMMKHRATELKEQWVGLSTKAREVRDEWLAAELTIAQENLDRMNNQQQLQAVEG